MTTSIRTLNQVEDEIQTQTWKLKDVEKRKAKLLDEEGDIRTKLTHLTIQRQRLLDLPGGTECAGE